MKKGIGRGICTVLLTIAVAAGTLAGCGGTASAKNKASTPKIDTDTVFEEIASPLDEILQTAPPASLEGGTARGEDAPAEDGMDIEGWNVNTVCAQNGRYYVMYSDYDGSSPRLCSFDENGGNVQDFLMAVSNDGWGMNMSVSPDGRVFILADTYDEKADRLIWSLHCFSLPGQNGKEMKEEWVRKISEDDEFYPSGMVSTGDRTALLTTDMVIFFSNRDGSRQKEIPLKEADSYQKICANPDGEILLTGSGKSGATAWRIDDSGNLKEMPIKADGFYYFDSAASGVGSYEYYACREDGIYGCAAGKDPVLAVDFVASDLEISSVQSFAVLSPDSILILDYGEEDLTPVLLRRADPAALADKTILTLGCTYAGDELRRAVVQFNKTSSRYKISIKEYPYDDEGHSGLNTEIAAGNIPDLILITEDLPMESYAAKGLFEDLEPMFKKDPEISANTYLDNILDTFRIDGKMYFVTPSFSVMGLMGKKKDFKDTKGVTIPQLEKMIKDRGLSYDKAMGLASRDTILNLVMYFAQDQYVDWDRYTCSFNTDSFVNLLEFAKKFPKKIDYNKVDWDAYDANMRAGKQLVRDVYLYSFASYMNERHGYIGEETAYMGYPGNGENGPSVSAETTIAMSSGTGNKEACWQFLRTFYLDSFQNSLDYSFPVSEKALEGLADRAMHPKTTTYIDENGEEVTETPLTSVYLNGKEIGIPVPSQKDVDAVIKILKGVRSRASIDSNISSIIQEEAGAFFEGQKSAKETADVIQSRVRVYIAEIR